MKLGLQQLKTYNLNKQAEDITWRVIDEQRKVIATFASEAEAKAYLAWRESREAGEQGAT